MTPIELLAWARILCGPVPRADLVTITGAAFDLNESLSPQVEAALPALLDKIKALAHTSLKTVHSRTDHSQDMFVTT